MVKLENNGKINFIVNIHYGYGTALTGGIVAMHYLAYLLAREGHNVYMFAKSQYPHKNIHILKSSARDLGSGKGTRITWENFTYDMQNTVAILDQDQWGDWFGTRWVARWMVHPIHKVGDDGMSIENSWGENNYYFTYGDQKDLIANSKEKDNQELIAMNFYFDTFKNENRKDRKGFCHLYNKHTSPGANDFLDELDSTNLNSWKKLGAHKYVNEEFNKHEYFICYDQLSFWPQVAALCGCKAIVMNVKDNPNALYDYNITPEEYRLENPLKKYGVAFGFGDLQHAIDTQHLVEDHLKEMDKQNLDTVKNFVKFWENKCYG